MNARHLSLLAGCLIAIVSSSEFGINELPQEWDTCMQIPFSLCVGSKETGMNLVGSNNLRKGLVGWWDFEDANAQDQSRYVNSVSPVPEAGPGFGGSGSSAYFNASAMSSIRHRPEFQSEDITISLWLFLLEDVVGGLRTIFVKGNPQDPTISLTLLPESRRLHLRVGTASSSGVRRSTVIDSLSMVPLTRWTHIAVVIEARLATIYVNGIMDAQNVLPSTIAYDSEPIYLSADPGRSGIACYMDDFQYFSLALSPQEVKATGSLAFPGLEALSPHLGCQSCRFSVAASSCRTYHHLCTAAEMETGALTIARTLGWLTVGRYVDQSSVFWTYPSSKQVAEAHAAGTQLGTAICCQD